MTKIKTVIIDDEPRNIKLVSRLIEDHCPALQVVGTTDDLSNAALLIKDTRPALLLLDIEFPAGTIFSMLEKLPFKDFEVIFITAHNTYAAEAFRQNAVDYILKPVNKDVLVSAVKRAENKIRGSNHTDLSKLLEELKSGLNHPKKIALPTGDGILFINEADIVRCEASGRYTVIYLHNKKKITIAKTLKEIEVILNSKLFFRIHNSHIINLDMVKKYHKSRMAELIDGSLVEVSSSRKNECLDIFLNKE